MSWQPLSCSECAIPARFERYGNVGMAGSLGVSWVCPRCGQRMLDVVPLHEGLPTPGMCLNCATPLAGAGACPSCGVDRDALLPAIHAACGDPPELGAALELIDRGLIRLATNAIDLRLELEPDDGDAWLARAEMLGERGVAWLRRAIEREPERAAPYAALHGLLARAKDYVGALAALDAMLELDDGSARANLQHARAELLCTLERADEGLAAIDEALALDDTSARWHYVRGWALGQLGELEAARAAMLRVLELSLDDPAARRALAQLDAALAG